uniref:C-type lectin domain-containing protein n=1 Tax=Xenopus tropicalis TaxID=8364 RepID=A0A6I8RJS3_XENTR
METVYSTVFEKAPASGKKKCSTRKLIFILMGQMFLVLIIMAALLFITFSEKSPCGSCWKQFNGSFYYFEATRMKWIEARSSCSKMNSDLVIINSEMEQEYLKSLTADDNYWIGLQKINDVWTWVDKTIMEESSGFWHEGEPNNMGGKENCVALTGSGDWNDASCFNRKFHAICKK